jgi:hypothetical protein
LKKIASLKNARNDGCKLTRNEYTRARQQIEIRAIRFIRGHKLLNADRMSALLFLRRDAENFLQLRVVDIKTVRRF